MIHEKLWRSLKEFCLYTNHSHFCFNNACAFSSIVLSTEILKGSQNDFSLQYLANIPTSFLLAAYNPGYSGKAEILEESPRSTGLGITENTRFPDNG